MANERSSASVVDFSTLSLGSGEPTSVPMETIKVEVGLGQMLRDFAKAFVQEAERKAPLKAERVQLHPMEVELYAQYLMKERVKSVNHECKDWRKLKLLYIPSFIQFNLKSVGVAKVEDFGLCLWPKYDGKVPSLRKALGIEDISTIYAEETHESDSFTLEDAFYVSERIAAFKSELQMVRDAMPRGEAGDVDVMSMALIDGYVRSFRKAGHISSSYVAAFLNLKLQDEVTWKAFYRVQYDDVKFIQMALLGEKVI